MASKLSPHQIAQQAFDEPSSSLKVSLQNTEVAIELDAADGDSVITIPTSFQEEVVVNTAQSIDTIAIPAQDVTGCRVISLFASNTGSSCTLAVDISPSATDDFWVEAGELVATTGSTQASPALAACKRARVRLKTAFAGDGVLKIYFNGRS